MCMLFGIYVTIIPTTMSQNEGIAKVLEKPILSLSYSYNWHLHVTSR